MRSLRPAAAVLGIFTFMQTWNDFLWPLVAMQDPSNPTVQISLRSLGNGYYQDYSQVFAATAVATVPICEICWHCVTLPICEICWHCVRAGLGISSCRRCKAS